MKQDKVIFFDTTLRDGEQCPGASMNLRQKLEVARQLEKLGVDVIEAGFPVISDGDFEAVSTIARTVKKCRVAGLARCVEKDIRAAAAAVAPAGDRARIHVFLATSPLHREFKLKKSKEEVIAMAVEGVKLAKSLVDDVEYSAEDASRTEHDFLAQVVEAVIDAGATTVNLPDTVGFTTPGEYAAMIGYMKKHVKNIDKCILSVHCHNDIGLAVANSLAAVGAGARQVEGTINGIGERAGNVAIEEVAMALTTRPEALGFAAGDVPHNLNTREIVKTSRVVARMSGLAVQRSKAIVGENAFAHSSGIHQHGILAKRETYEVIDPATVGWGETELPLTKHSGRAAVKARLEKLGHSLSAEELTQVFERFKKVGDSKKFVYDDDLASLVNDSLDTHNGVWKMVHIQFVAGDACQPTATVTLEKEGKKFTDCGIGNGPVNACFKAIDRITRTKGALVGFNVQASSCGQDAVGEVAVKVQFGDENEKPVSGKGAATDIIEASARAYLNAVNRSLTLARLNQDNA
ncbi:MAG: 2-isopropylmalate synthase [Akkermansia sp.]|nr:2-isopropylmalate synthase [Akkermansia sp.]